MNDRERAEELLRQAWEHEPTHGLERVEMLVSALVHAVLASEEATRRANGRVATGPWQESTRVRAVDRSLRPAGT